MVLFPEGKKGGKGGGGTPHTHTISANAEFAADHILL